MSYLDAGKGGKRNKPPASPQSLLPTELKEANTSIEAKLTKFKGILR